MHDYYRKKAHTREYAQNDIGSPWTKIKYNKLEAKID